MGFKVLIVDDERLAREKIRALLTGESDFEIVGESGTASGALEAIARERPDVLFLDVEMPGGDGFALIRQLGPPLPEIVFVTAHEDHALAAFEVGAFDYVLKPFDRDRFRKALDRVRGRIGRGEGPLRKRLDRLIATLEPRGPFLTRLPVSEHGRTRFVDATLIDWIEAQDNYVKIHVGNSSFLIREVLGRLEAKLEPGHFLRVHRSALVNASAVRELRTLFHGDLELVLRSGSVVRVGRFYRRDLKDKIGTH